MGDPPPDTGSALFLMPAALLIVVLLAAIAVDLSVAYLGRRELLDTAAAAANDAATYGVDQQAYLAGEGIRLDARRVDAAVREAVAGRDLRVEDLSIDVAIDGLQVTVTIEGDISLVFARAIPGAAVTAHVAARSVAEAG